MSSPLRLAREDLPAFHDQRHEQLWAQVPVAFRTWTYPILQPPFNDVLIGSGVTTLTLPVQALAESLRQELAWWVWHCADTGCRRINSSWLRNTVLALVELQSRRSHDPIRSLLSVSRVQLQHAYQEQYHRQRGQLPAAATVRSTDCEASLIQQALALRHDPQDWWRHDTWTPRDDPRIPLRQHEPNGSQSLRFAGLRTPWLREAAKFYIRMGLESRQASWSTSRQRMVSLRYFDDFLIDRALVHPALVDDPVEQLRAVMLDFRSAMRARTVRGTDHRLSDHTVSRAQLTIAVFYAFLLDHRHEVVTATGDRRLLQLTEAHSRLWRSTDLPFTGNRVLGDVDGSRYIEDSDLSRMIEHVEIVGIPRDCTTKIVRDGQELSVFGLGDPSAMRAWLIQALTGRRASEVLMTDFNPLSDVPGLPHAQPEGHIAVGAAGNDGREDFVAKYRYQQTKVRRAPNAILVGADVVAVIREQQAWTRQRLGLTKEDQDPPYLFPAHRQNRRGTRPRSIATYQSVLGELTELLQLRDRHGKLLAFSQSHRLRHTKATNLLNLGAPIHVVMRYMGHRSPDMTMHYAQTLAQTAEREFLRTQRIGHDGRDIQVAAQDLFDMVALSARTDRVLPTGLCLLPPTKRCDKGNACYSCEFFATDRSNLQDHRQLLADTHRLIEARKQQILNRTGRQLGEDNVWLREQLATVRALELVIATLEQQGSHDQSGSLRGAGVRGRDSYQPGPVPLQLTARQEAPGAG